MLPLEPMMAFAFADKWKAIYSITHAPEEMIGVLKYTRVQVLVDFLGFFLW